MKYVTGQRIKLKRPVAFTEETVFWYIAKQGKRYVVIDDGKKRQKIELKES